MSHNVTLSRTGGKAALLRPCHLVAWELHTPRPATITFYDGTDNTAPVVATEDVHGTHNVPQAALAFTSGCFVEIIGAADDSDITGWLRFEPVHTNA